MILDAFVEARLRDGGVVDFAVTVAAIADEVDDDSSAKLRARLGGELSNPHDGVGIFAIYVKEGNGLALGDLRAAAGGMLLLRRGGEAHRIGDDHVNVAADGVGVGM